MIKAQRLIMDILIYRLVNIIMYVFLMLVLCCIVLLICNL